MCGLLEKYQWYWEIKNESKVSDWHSGGQFTENHMGFEYLEWEESMGHPRGNFQPVLGWIRLNLGQALWIVDKDL